MTITDNTTTQKPTNTLSMEANDKIDFNAVIQLFEKFSINVENALQMRLKEYTD